MSIRLMLLCMAAAVAFRAEADTVPQGSVMSPVWHVGAEVSGAAVPGTCTFLRGDNPEGRRVASSLGGSVRAGFSFNPSSRTARLYRGLYQGVGIGMDGFVAGDVLGSPVSVYVYQGAPIVRLGSRLTLGYEWQFGAAMGWRHHPAQSADNNAAVSTAVTARLGVGLRLCYALSPRWRLIAGVEARHYSNGNTHWPNGGVNTLGAVAGVAYILTPRDGSPEGADAALAAEADRGRWLCDVTLYGAWRKQIVNLNGDDELCPGRFGVAGIQIAPARRLNRYVAIGPSLDMQWDEGAGLAPYWVEGSAGDAMKFRRPPFWRQLHLGLSAHAELTMPIFAVNAGLGVDLLCPRGESRFYQSLTLKTFVTGRLYINAGYRLSAFRHPQNLMLGLGIRL
ncbi:MAG: acyloxyacyl hydrolase [Bacteroides sp.]|nr:acyloxyacyl hydrolase [Bacteroides sp.]MCM1095541.1 acyloxyacyl hydrolase [Terasakiella sp.]